MRVVKQILNSEGILLAIAEDKSILYLMVKEDHRNEYSYFPLHKEKLISYLNGEIPLVNMIPSKESFACAIDYYDKLHKGLIGDSKQEIIDSI